MVHPPPHSFNPLTIVAHLSYTVSHPSGPILSPGTPNCLLGLSSTSVTQSSSESSAVSHLSPWVTHSSPLVSHPSSGVNCSFGVADSSGLLRYQWYNSNLSKSRKRGISKRLNSLIDESKNLLCLPLPRRNLVRPKKRSCVPVT